MQPILFHLPILGIPIYGYGLMLFFAFIFCNWLARRLCKREGIDPNLIPDLAIWFFVSGILGGRLVFVIQYWQRFENRPFWDLVKLWDGGLVLYGAVFGATIGFFAYHHFVLRKHGVSVWKMFDVIAPCVALGIALGRVGCLFTGCCYGNVAGENCPRPLHFPNPAAGWEKMVERGYQTPWGFLLKDDSFEVAAVEPGSEAAEVLQPGDVILEVNGKAPLTPSYVVPVDGELKLTVFRDGKSEMLPPFTPRSIGLNPTQPFETISMCLLLFFLLSYHPFKRHDGELLVFLMFGYGVHRFLNEMLRTDTDPVAFGLTLSQNISIGILAVGVVLAVMVWRRPATDSVQPAMTAIAPAQPPE